ncbi:MAG: SDR family NAD(P)-dependent oxidoreductase [Planctomycetes bacterium]|nr:SDR family NAD(P)-dependent oxidoreductase [Planctomycetota bacterium]
MPNPWAVVTGASSGIGAAIANELGRRKWSVVLVGRDEAALAEQARAVAAHSVEALPIAADLASAAGLEILKRRLAQDGLAPEILVNNAGFGLHGPFEKSDGVAAAKMIDLQLKGMVELTRAFLPAMLERKSGRILNVASVYAFSPVQNQAVYAACKAFMLSFSRSLALELYGSGVTVSVLCPGITHTRFRSRAGMQDKPSAFALEASAVAALGVRGLLQGRLLIVPGWGNRLYVASARCLPSGVLGGFTKWFNRRRGIAGHAEGRV